MKRAALISVSDKEGLVEFVAGLKELGFAVLTSSGSGRYLREHGISSLAIEEYTGQAEILDGRVKTLHPRIHAGLLALRDNPAHMQELEKQGIYSFDVVAVNLYPFSSRVEGAQRLNPQAMLEFIDVGGSAIFRAAAKNFKSVFIASSPADYRVVLDCLRSGEEDEGAGLELKRLLAVKAFGALASDNFEIARYLSSLRFKDKASGFVLAGSEDHASFGDVMGFVLWKKQDLRYGENPHQHAALYGNYAASLQHGLPWEQLSGKELSYNNLLDCDAAVHLVRSFSSSGAFCAILKHLNPCGAALGDTPLEALRKAKLCDPRSHFGGIIIFNQEVDLDTAQAVREDFAEIVLAPGFSSEALSALARNKNLRLMQTRLETRPTPLQLRSIEGGILVQERDGMVSLVADAQSMTPREPLPAELDDLQFAWTLAANVKSNAIVIVRDGMLIGVGAGQMSRVDSTELALDRARLHGHDLNGAVAASDAFFPFPDSIEKLAEAGIKAVIAPAGAKRDEEVADEASRQGMSLLFVSDRHFRH